MVAVAVCGPVLWLMGWLVTGHRGWAWLPLFACAALLPLLDFLSPAIDRYLSTLSAVLTFLTVVGLALYAASKARALAVRVGAAALLIPVAFLVALDVGVTALVGSIG